MKLKGKIVLVTGAAGQLGRQYCTAFAEEGAEVWASDTALVKCDQMVAQLPGAGPHHAVSADVASPISVQQMFKRIGEVSGRIDVLINNAGIGVFTPFEERSFDEFMEVFRVNAGGTFLCTQHGSQLMREVGNGGCIINIGSIYGVVSGDPRIYTDCARKTSECYGGSKAAVIQMTRYFAVHLAPFGIRVNCISPGGVFNDQGDDFVKNYAARTPLGRMARETELRGLAVFLASDDASYVTGQNIIVDGGWTVW